jgi:FtsP/CotA-like multicopper oxidase with cupredoxin domain
MTTGISPYVTPVPSDSDPALDVLETVLVASHAMVDIGGVVANAETFNGAIPGPTLRFNVGDTAIVRLINLLEHPTGIHWHGIELANSADGTEVTQEAVVPAFAMPPPSPAPAGGTYLYKFKLPRPGLYWYHPHHHLSTNRVFRGLYGMIIVADPNEAALIAAGVIPDAPDTRELVLSDITVCKAPGSNDAATYDPMLPWPWVGGGALPAQGAPNPVDLCEIGPGGATNDDGTPAVVSYGAGDVPSIVRPPGLLHEGQTVLTNGVNVGGRAGSPFAPGDPAEDAQTIPVLSGQGLRLQIVNCATIRYFRLILTTDAGVQVPLVRIGGEGGLLDNAVLEGGTIGGFNTKYTEGEILIPPASRADVVAAIPPGTTGVLTLWTQDFERTGPVGGTNFSKIPTVPVMHLNVTGAAPSTYTIGDGTPLRASIPGQAVETLGAPDAVLLDPATFVPSKPGMPNQDIQITTPPGINGTVGNFEGFTPYTSAPHIDSSRFAEAGRTLQLTLTNTSAAHHPFHLHGFSFQPISLTHPAQPDFTWPYREFRDNIDVPGGYTLTFRVRLDDRELVDGLTLGGLLGRWLFHCHIFFHHHQGMISEFVVTAADGSEKPNVDVRGSWAYTPAGGIATRNGTYQHPDGDPVTLTASFGTVTSTGPSTWDWMVDSTGLPDQTQYVYITGTDPAGRRDQAVFRLKIGAPDDGADIGDPHVHTIDGKRYDFQAIGEFTLFRDLDSGMEVQARHWPVQTATPITDSYSGLQSCVSVNTAVAARVGSHRIAYQPTREGSWFQFYLDGKPSRLPFTGIDLDAHRVAAFTIPGGGTALRVDYEHGAVLTITPYFWNSYNIWLLNVNISHTQGDEGIMGRIPEGTWLPALPSGATVGPMPDDLHDRYVTLYHTFADAWRVTDDTSLFVYEPGTSTATFIDKDWPAEKPPCKLKPQFQVPGANPKPANIPIAKAKKICEAVTIEGLHRDCVFDVATTGDEEFARFYLIEQELRLRASAVQIVADKEKTRRGEKLSITATVIPLRYKGPTPTGAVTFLVEGKPAGGPVKLDERGRATFTFDRFNRGVHKIRAAYEGSGEESYHSSTSPNLVHTVVYPETGPATTRRVLKFLNAARSPQDLVATPPREVPFIDERQAHGIHLDENHSRGEQPGGHGHGAPGHGAPASVGRGHGRRQALFNRHVANHVLADRIRKRPVHGFAHIDEVLDVEHFKPELLDHLFTLLGPGVYGEWEVLHDGAGTPFEIAHAALLHNGNVLFIPESFAATDTLLWDPGDPNHATALRTLSGAATGLTGVLFCGAHCFLQDGKLLVVGGGTNASGTVDAWKFNPVAETWQKTAGSMSAARWYPTTVALGEDSGRVLVANGGPVSMEIYSETTDSFVPVHGPAGPGDNSADRAFPELYPGLHLLPSGTVFFTRTGNNNGTDPAAYFTFSTPTSGSWTGLTGGSAGEDRGRGMSLLLLRQQPTDPDRILVIGGGNTPTQSTVGLIDNPPTSAAWLSGSLPDGLPRSSVNGVLLPDGTVLICGGRPTGGTPPNGGVCYVYDPSAGLGVGAFSEMDELSYARQYHSVAILLPSAKVMITGGSSETIEVFSPPYLFNSDGTPASRPVIDSYPDPGVGTIILHGSTFEVETAQAPDIAKVVMVRPMAVTHQTDAEQRALALSWTLTSPTTLAVTAPDGRIFPYAGGGGHTHASAPRGYYMLFVINSSGVPSEAKFVRLI